MTNHHLVSYGGSEVFTLELAKLLAGHHHTVCVYTKYLDRLEEDFNRYKIPVTTNLADYDGIPFDVAHLHNIIITSNHNPPMQ